MPDAPGNDTAVTEPANGKVELAFNEATSELQEDETETARTDSVVIGRGIAGLALAAAMAADGHEVLLLERQTVYRDKVRDEVINCWGVAELLQLGLEKAILKAGGTYIDRFVGFDETVDPDTAWARAPHLDELMPGIRRVLDVGHSEACQALSTATSEAGATVVRDIGHVRVTAEARPSVRYERDGTGHEVADPAGRRHGRADIRRAQSADPDPAELRGRAIRTSVPIEVTLPGHVRTTINMTFSEQAVRRRKASAQAWPKDPVVGGSRLATFKGPFGVPTGRSTRRHRVPL